MTSTTEHKTTDVNPRTPLLLLGTGFIGGSLLTALLEADQYSITALCRQDDQAKMLMKLGVTPLMGSLDSHDLIKDATVASDIIIHTATADDQPSVKAILAGLAAKSTSARAPIYIHTSGAGALKDEGKSLQPSTKIYHDKSPEDIDSLPDDALHRDVDLLIKNAVENEEVGHARVAIILPSLVYGTGSGPFNKISIDIPAWIRDSLEAKEVPVIGNGMAVWGQVHIQNLVRAYLLVLQNLSLSAAPARPLYYFVEDGEFTWIELATAIRDALEKRGLTKHELRMGRPQGYRGTNARCRSDRLKELGWKPRDFGDVCSNVDADVEAVLKAE